MFALRDDASSSLGLVPACITRHLDNGIFTMFAPSEDTKNCSLKRFFSAADGKHDDALL